MTMEEIKASKKDFLIARDVASILRLDPPTLRRQAIEDPSKLGFPVIVMGASVRIPRKPFIKFMEG